MVNAAAPLLQDDGRLIGPIYTQERFVEIMWDESRRFARPPPGAPSVQRTWRPTLSILDLLRHQVTGQGRRLMIALYPSVLQIYPEIWEQLERELRQRPRLAATVPAEVDLSLPNRVVLEYCRIAALECYDTTPNLAVASRQSPEPLYKARDTHWTVRGNHVVAEIQARWLQRIVCPSVPVTAGPHGVRGSPPSQAAGQRSAEGDWPPAPSGRVNS